MKVFDHILLGFILLLVFVFLGCDEGGDSSEHPLVGTHQLTELTVIVYAVSNVDTFGISTMDSGTVLIEKNDPVYDDTTVYTIGEEGTSVYGTVILANNGNATLLGVLPIYLPCDSLGQTITDTLVGSNGTWQVNAADSSFILDLEIDQLDISGSYSYDDISKILIINYTTIDTSDTLGITTIQGLNIENVCLPVTSTTERTFEFLKE
ncbi:MAG: hypothetical protein H8E82_06795 [Candidatus Marinimicrobia bacterium]|nr:hypothetical protein [Candidatus Neomarinimicrobiota bacterium]